MPFASDAEMRRVAHHAAAAAREVGADVEAEVYERLMAAGCDERAALRCARDVARTDDAPPSQHEGGTAPLAALKRILYVCAAPGSDESKVATVREHAIGAINAACAQPPAPSAPVEEPGGYDRPCPKCGAKTQFASATGEHGAGLARVCVSKTCDWRSIPTPAA